MNNLHAHTLLFRQNNLIANLEENILQKKKQLDVLDNKILNLEEEIAKNQRLVRRSFSRKDLTIKKLTLENLLIERNEVNEQIVQLEIKLNLSKLNHDSQVMKI